MSILLYVFNWGKKELMNKSKILISLSLSPSIMNVEDSESSLKVVRSYDS